MEVCEVRKKRLDKDSCEYCWKRSDQKISEIDLTTFQDILEEYFFSPLDRPVF
jgi:hypothetical protein